MVIEIRRIWAMTFLTIEEYKRELPGVKVGESGYGYWWAELPDGSIITEATELIAWETARILLGVERAD